MQGKVVIRAATPADRSAIRDLWLLALDAGELTGFTAVDVDHLIQRLNVDDSGLFVADEGGRLAGFVYARPRIVVLHPERRRLGFGRRLVDRAEEDAAARGEPFLLWLPDGNQGAAAFLAALSFRYAASLWDMTLAPAVPVDPPRFPADAELRRVDEVPLATYVAMSNEAFDDHPTPLRVTEALVSWTHAQPGFDPATVLVLIDRASNEPVGIAKVSLEEDTGEVDLIGLRPAWRGRGLGRELLRWSIAAHRERGASEIVLRVEGRNPTALALYERTGFVRSREWRRFARAADLGT